MEEEIRKCVAMLLNKKEFKLTKREADGSHVSVSELVIISIYKYEKNQFERMEKGEVSK